MTVTFKCGHVVKIPRTVTDPPQCPECGERVVTRVKDAVPRFTGSCTGPYVVKQA